MDDDKHVTIKVPERRGAQGHRDQAVLLLPQSRQQGREARSALRRASGRSRACRTDRRLREHEAGRQNAADAVYQPCSAAKKVFWNWK